ncbi:Pyruvate dehydrogenase complex repressor [Pseudovibrio sp. W64]|jgi:DNA-binding GntR family transcriptional regulator|uniref:DNA-binding transcriptional regulator, GntR family n=1 Tax=Pseudovibrio ascidiaceicola TaxID=285279 RepID=A0A1I3YR23_9HYPH|nr:MULTISPECIES: GntR family transcriptional regulator [Pseudovibrio]KZK75558.1 Pyruvate dehydrogenase complex repressor [Pseudovibrio sp. W64]KZK93921.1 Pyruvate dehydrogenase complex repressor [Pseudovibrio sp. Ad46]KZL00134.1 Pyruvate dehydrogenase complex repressor [Pseudovibrio sp. Ad5]KZL01257.1 Pyruvate dehydrogenase complex repressor [Pseudovibrio sp. W74]KZL11322.1 Pyruvate dehydrogenase complex repressor [Pseudovibrio sp. Ad14]
MKISKQSLEEQAADFLRQQILAGHYVSGDKLTESTLAKGLELSRTTVRMALNTLSSEGLVSQKPYAGWSVTTLTDHDIWEIYHLRVALESQAAQMAAETITPEKAVRLRKELEVFKEICQQDGVSLTEVTFYDFELHKLIIELSESARLAHMYKSVINQLSIYIRITHFDFDIEDSANTHVGLVEAICSGEAEKARKLAIENISTFTEMGHKLKHEHVKLATDD